MTSPSAPSAPPATETATTIATPSRTPSPETDPPPTPSPTPTASSGQEPGPVAPDEVWSEPAPRPHPRTSVNPEPPRRVPNAVRSFWVVNRETGGRREIEARLQVQTSNVAIWVELGVWHDIRRLEEVAELFGTHTCPRIRAAFGSEWQPGIDNDPRVHIVHATALGENVLGYTSSVDVYPREMHPLSNEAEMIVVNVDGVEVGSSTYHALLARQFQRLVQWNQDRNEERWLKEGLAELAVALSGFSIDPSAQAYPERTDTSLIHWTGEPGQREAVSLFAAYFHQRFGDQGIRLLTTEPANGIAGISAVLERLDAGLSFEDLFGGWLAANYLDHSWEGEADDLHLSHTNIGLEQVTPAAVPGAYPTEIETTVEQFGADYIVLRGDADLNVQFRGRTQTPLLSASPYNGRRAWWSNRADESLTTMTGRFDLSAVEEATFSCRIWYDIEPHYDYATIAVKAVDDDNWQIVTTPSGTDANPHGNSPGWSYTGKSAGWIREEIDLSDHAGKEVLVRFSYLTDGAITGEGFLLDAVSIPEIGYSDDLATESHRWEARGFLPIGPSVPQRYLALLISRGEEVTVERLPVPENQTAEWTVALSDKALDEAVLIISGLGLLTTRSAPYQLRIRD